MGEERGEVFGVETAGVRAVHSWHHAGIEYVDVDLQPVSGPRNRVNGCSNRHRSARYGLAGRQDKTESPARLKGFFVLLPVAYVDGAVRREVRSLPIDVSDGGPVQSYSGGEVLAGHTGALVAVTGVAEVGMTIDMSQTGPAPA